MPHRPPSPPPPMPASHLAPKRPGYVAGRNGDASAAQKHDRRKKLEPEIVKLAVCGSVGERGVSSCAAREQRRLSPESCTASSSSGAAAAAVWRQQQRAWPHKGPRPRC